MSTHKIGDWVAIITDEDGKVCTGQISLIEISAAGTKYTVDILADDKYRHLADPRWIPNSEFLTDRCIDEIADLL